MCETSKAWHCQHRDHQDGATNGRTHPEYTLVCPRPYIRKPLPDGRGSFGAHPPNYSATIPLKTPTVLQFRAVTADPAARSSTPGDSFDRPAPPA